MTANRPTEVLELTVALDYGQCYLLGQRSQHPTGDDPTLQLLDTAINGPGIASSEGNEVVVVLSPHQNNFAMRLRVELWATQPPDDLDDWQEVFLTGLVVGEEGLAYETPTLEGATIAVPPGRYAAQIAGRGFLNRGWPGSTTPGDGWRIQLWPASGPIPARRLRSWSGPASASFQPPLGPIAHATIGHLVLPYGRKFIVVSGSLKAGVVLTPGRSCMLSGW